MKNRQSTVETAAIMFAVVFAFFGPMPDLSAVFGDGAQSVLLLVVVAGVILALKGFQHQDGKRARGDADSSSAVGAESESGKGGV